MFPSEEEATEKNKIDHKFAQLCMNQTNLNKFPIIQNHLYGTQAPLSVSFPCLVNNSARPTGAFTGWGHRNNL